MIEDHLNGLPLATVPHRRQFLLPPPLWGRMEEGGTRRSKRHPPIPTFPLKGGRGRFTGSVGTWNMRHSRAIDNRPCLPAGLEAGTMDAFHSMVDRFSLQKFLVLVVAHQRIQLGRIGNLKFEKPSLTVGRLVHEGRIF